MSDAEKLSDKAKSLICQADQLYVSSASIWEMAIKSRLGKLEVDMPLFLHELTYSLMLRDLIATKVAPTEYGLH